MNAHKTIASSLAFAALATAPAFAATESITVTEPRTRQDELITRDVMVALASDPRLSGRISVQTVDRKVELNGIVVTAGQSRQAERDARAVQGVLAVHNKLSTRLGGGRY